MGTVLSIAGAMMIRTRVIRARIIGACAGLLLGCGDQAGPLALTIGTGEAAFAPLADGQEVSLVRGSQGGHHAWVSLRASGMTSEYGLVEIRWEDLSGNRETLEGSPVRLRFAELEPEETDPAHVDPEVRELVGYPGVVAQPGCWLDRDVRLEVRLTDAMGAVAEDARIVVLRADDLDGCGP